MARSIMLVGLGGLGFDMLQFLARTPGVSEIVTADKDGTTGLFKTHNAIHGASCEGHYPRIRFVQMDVRPYIWVWARKARSSLSAMGEKCCPENCRPQASLPPPGAE